jgi:hypothetical protein
LAAVIASSWLAAFVESFGLIVPAELMLARGPTVDAFAVVAVPTVAAVPVEAAKVLTAVGGA